MDHGKQTVQWTRKQLQPYTKYVVVLAKPALTSMSFAFAAGAFPPMKSPPVPTLHDRSTHANRLACCMHPLTRTTAKLAARSSMAAVQGAHNTVFSDD